MPHIIIKFEVNRHSQTLRAVHDLTCQVISALPFVLTKDEAIEAMNDHAAGLSLNFGHMAKAFMRGLFTSLDIPALTPSRIQAVYLPTWVVDAEVEAKVYGMNEDDKDSGTAVSHFLTRMVLQYG